nr:hypothetical protein Iba_scaffold1979CG0040 [Ipomoea batatas]
MKKWAPPNALIGASPLAESATRDGRSILSNPRLDDLANELNDTGNIRRTGAIAGNGQDAQGKKRGRRPWPPSSLQMTAMALKWPWPSFMDSRGQTATAVQGRRQPPAVELVAV